MLASWMAYASLVSAALAVTGIALERLALAQRWPVRWVWSGVLTASVALPCATTALLRSSSSTPAIAEPSIAGLPFTVTVTVGSAEQNGPRDSAQTDVRALASSGVLAIAWLAASALLLGRLALSVVVLGRRARSWEHASVDGVAVRLSASDGPAVVNLRRMDIVLPRWILSLDSPLRALVLRHEQEHRLARDPQLLLLASLLVAIAPWNLALWFALGRLRLAVELDCDARVLRAHPSPERYGLLMLTVAQRHAAPRAWFAPSLSATTSHLERRILAMHTTHIARRTKVLATLTAAASIAMACTFRPAMAQASGSTRAAFEAFMNAQGFQSWTTVRAAHGNTPPRYPEQLRAAGTEGAVLTALVVDTAGRVDANSVRILESTNVGFSEAVRAVLPSMRFVAAQVDGHNVKQLVQVPFAFGIGDHAVVPASMEAAHATMPCDRGACPVLRLETVVITAAR